VFIANLNTVKERVPGSGSTVNLLTEDRIVVFEIMED